MQDKLDRIKRAKELLNTVKFATIATVNKDGSPHNSPLLLLYNEKLTKIYWGSHPKSIHSQNILRTGQLFMVLYDSFNGGGLYIRSKNGHIVKGKELDEALLVHNTFRKKYGKAPLELKYYTGGSEQKMWSANITNFWVNSVERGKDGHLNKDFRIEIKSEDLIS